MTVETLNETVTTKEVKIIVGQEDFNKKYDDKLKKLSKTIKLEGFRKGKVPVALVKKRFGKSIKAEITEDLLQETSTSYLDNLKELLVAQPQMDDFKQEGKGGFYYTIKYEFIPEFDMGQYTNLDIEVEVEKLSNEEFDKYVTEQFLPGFSQKLPVEGREIVEDKDLAIIDIKAYKDGKDVEEFNKVDFPLEIGKNIFEGIDAVVLGKKIGEELEFNYVKDENSDAILFKISIKGIETFVTPELNEEFVQQYFAHGREEYNLEAFQKDLRGEYQLQLDRKNNGKLVEKFIDLAGSRYELDIPKTILDGAKQDYLNRHLQANEGLKVEDKEAFYKEHEELINKLAREQVFILKLKEAEDIKAEQNDIVNYIQSFSRQYGLPQEEAMKIFSDRNRYAEIVALVENQKIEEFIIQNNNLKDTVSSSDSAPIAE